MRRTAYIQDRCWTHGGKVNLSRREARRVLKVHQKSLCSQCMSGQCAWELYPCQGTDFWHNGHRLLSLRELQARRRTSTIGTLAAGG
jgi:hypothetical protein